MTRGNEIITKSMWFDNKIINASGRSVGTVVITKRQSCFLYPFRKPLFYFGENLCGNKCKFDHLRVFHKYFRDVPQDADSFTVRFFSFNNRFCELDVPLPF